MIVVMLERPYPIPFPALMLNPVTSFCFKESFILDQATQRVKLDGSTSGQSPRILE